MINGMYALDKAPTDCKSISFSEQRKAKKTISDAMKKLCIGSDVGNGIDEETTRILSGDGGTGFDAKALQNRDRSRASYVAQMTKIAKNPDYDMISTSKTPETGAPMVFSRNTVIPPAQAGKKSSPRPWGCFVQGIFYDAEPHRNTSEDSELSLKVLVKACLLLEKAGFSGVWHYPWAVFEQCVDLASKD